MRIECVTRSEKEINYEMRKEKVERRQEGKRLEKKYMRRTHQIR